MELTRPAQWLRAGAFESLGDTNVQNQCIYAAGLGYIDICIFSATINTRRALATDFIALEGGEPVYLITERNPSFEANLAFIFAPFSPETWLLIALGVIPLLGLLTLVHEYGNPTFPASQKSVVVNAAGELINREERIPPWKHAIRSVYFSFYSTMRGSYDVSVFSTGGFVNTLGISFFIVSIIAVYTGTQQHDIPHSATLY